MINKFYFVYLNQLNIEWYFDSILYLSRRFGGTSLRRMYLSTSNMNLLRLVMSNCTHAIAAVNTCYKKDKNETIAFKYKKFPTKFFEKWSNINLRQIFTWYSESTFKFSLPRRSSEQIISFGKSPNSSSWLIATKFSQI